MEHIKAGQKKITYGLLMLGALPYAGCFYLLIVNHYEINYVWSAIVVAACYLMLIVRPAFSVIKLCEESPLNAESRIIFAMVVTYAIVFVFLFNSASKSPYFMSMGYLMLVISGLTIAAAEFTILTWVAIYKQKKQSDIFYGVFALLWSFLLATIWLYERWMDKLS